MQHGQVVVLSDFTVFVPTLPDRAHSQLAAQAPSNIGDLDEEADANHARRL
jgi:hypothetical protein